MHYFYEKALRTQHAQELVEITASVKEAVLKSGVKNGKVLIYCPHTTAGITINENADRDVVRDLLMKLDDVFPILDGRYRHMEGNSHAHLKASFMGSGQTVPIAGGALYLGTWQGIYFCEFDGPRSRRYAISIDGD